MFISIHDLELRKIEFRETFAPGSIDFGPEIVQKEPVVAEGRAELIEEHHGGRIYVKDIRLVGHARGSFELRCARCLEPVAIPWQQDFDLMYRPLGAVKMPDEAAITDADTEIGYYQGNGLLLEDVLKEQVVLAMPLRALCREDCKGLCPHCGVNRNTTECDCDESRVDPRWSALADLKERLKN
jgi:uncharacterized protein